MGSGRVQLGDSAAQPEAVAELLERRFRLDVETAANELPSVREIAIRASVESALRDAARRHRRSTRATRRAGQAVGWVWAAVLLAVPVWLVIASGGGDGWPGVGAGPVPVLLFVMICAGWPALLDWVTPRSC